VPIFFLIALSVISAVIWHLSVRRFIIATIGATVTTIAIYQGAGYFFEGAPERLWLRALLITATPALVAAMLVGWAVHRTRGMGGRGAL
jgi:hypothetical protein